jgi:hypothetical protein
MKDILFGIRECYKVKKNWFRHDKTIDYFPFYKNQFQPKIYMVFHFCLIYKKTILFHASSLGIISTNFSFLYFIHYSVNILSLLMYFFSLNYIKKLSGKKGIFVCYKKIKIKRKFYILNKKNMNILFLLIFQNKITLIVMFDRFIRKRYRDIYHFY